MNLKRREAYNHRWLGAAAQYNINNKRIQPKSLSGKNFQIWFDQIFNLSGLDNKQEKI